MTEAVDIDCQSVTKPVSRQALTVSASALALHLDCSRTYIGKLKRTRSCERHYSRIQERKIASRPPEAAHLAQQTTPAIVVFRGGA